jgi:hypothetical protein
VSSTGEKKFKIACPLGKGGAKCVSPAEEICYNTPNERRSFTKLFKYMEKRFDEVDKRFDEAARDRADIRGAVAELSAQVRHYHNESLFLNHHVDKLTEAIKQIAKETGVKLTVEI